MMSAKNGMRTVLRAVPALLAGALLTACASVQVDVDVYKGPFAHEKEIQVKQYASLATSAKPVLNDLHERVWRRNDKKKNKVVTGIEIPNKLYTEKAKEDRCRMNTRDGLEFNEKFLCEILDLYVDTRITFAARADGTGARTEEKIGLDRLTENVTNELSNGTSKTQDEAIAKLNEALIFFAQKVLFTVNNQQLFDDLDAADQLTINTQTAVLQSLGNTILVHANDLQRRKVHATQHKDAADAEHKAVASAFRLTPSAAFDSIVDQLNAQSIPTLGGAAPASRPADSVPAPAGSDLERHKATLDILRADGAAFRAGLAPLVAAYRTVVGEPTTLSAGEAASAVDQLSATQDRSAIAKLYLAVATSEADQGADGALKPLMDWLDLEAGNGVVVSPQREKRLANMKAYMVAENGRLLGAGIASVDSRDAILKLVAANITQRAELAVRHLDEQAKNIKAQETLVRNLGAKVTRAESAAAAKRAADTTAEMRNSDRKSVIAVIESVRRDVVEQSEAAKVKGESGVRSLLKVKLAALSPATGGGKPSSDDIVRARAAVENLAPDPIPPCEAAAAGAGCAADTSLKVIDNLIASLRAQRVRALAAGDTRSAAHIMTAIEAAYSQRTSMIYLRPASDYLRSVYSSSAFQDGTDKQYRNMLTDSLKNYMNPLERDRKDVKEELEKLYWQNVNKVTVSGGGQTNYVLAKDDVGNWYVKAYSADPEAVMKSATSLAMFSAGKGMNVNLLRRYELQRKLDEDKGLSTQQRSDLRKDLAESDRQDGLPLLKVRDRYATRYASDTAQQVSALHQTLSNLAAKVKDAATDTKGKPDDCDAAKVTEGLGALDTAYLGAARTRLEKLAAANATAADPATPATASTTQAENAIQAGLTGIHLYAAQAHKAVSESTAAGCAPWQLSAAKSARTYAQAQLVGMATERKLSIERYEDALASIADIAGEKK